MDSPIANVYKDLLSANRYEAPIIATWREASKGAVAPERVPFTKEDIVRHGRALTKLGVDTEALDVKNVPDIIYTFRARSELPAEILKHGNYAIIGCGKGKYCFSSIPNPNRVRLPAVIKEETVSNRIPKWVQPYMGNDEQGMLTRISHNDLIQSYLGLKQAFRLQSHLRMGVPNYGQVEVDELYAGEDIDGEHIIIGVEAKDVSDNDLLNISQLFGTAQALRATFPTLKKRLVGVKPDSAGRVCICEFAVPTQVKELKAVGDWKAYKLQ